MPLPHGGGQEGRTRRSRPPSNASRVTNALNAREAEAGVCDGGSKADLLTHEGQHPRTRICLRTGTQHAPLALSGRRCSRLEELPDSPRPATGSAAVDQPAYWREGLKHLHCRGLSDRDLLTQTCVMNRRACVQRSRCSGVLALNCLGAVL